MRCFIKLVKVVTGSELGRTSESQVSLDIEVLVSIVCLPILKSQYALGPSNPTRPDRQSDRISLEIKRAYQDMSCSFWYGGFWNSKLMKSSAVPTFDERDTERQLWSEKVQFQAPINE